LEPLGISLLRNKVEEGLAIKKEAAELCLVEENPAEALNNLLLILGNISSLGLEVQNFLQTPYRSWS